MRLMKIRYTSLFWHALKVEVSMFEFHLEIKWWDFQVDQPRSTYQTQSAEYPIPWNQDSFKHRATKELIHPGNSLKVILSKCRAPFATKKSTDIPPCVATFCISGAIHFSTISSFSAWMIIRRGFSSLVDIWVRYSLIFHELLRKGLRYWYGSHLWG